MATQTPLMNPSDRDIVDPNNNYNQEVNSENKREIQDEFYLDKNQLPLEIDSNEDRLRQYFGSVKHKSKSRLEFLEVSAFWRNFTIPFMIVTSISNILIMLIGGIFIFDNISPTTQLFFDPVEETWFTNTAFNKIIIFILPIFLLCFFLIQFRLVKFIFKSDRRLALSLSWIISFLNIAMMIAISQIYSLNT